MVTLQAGETLIAAGTSAAFVYIPLANGLSVLPLGGYPPVTVGAWMPVGHTGVIRGAPRNATVVAQRALRLLMLPRGVPAPLAPSLQRDRPARPPDVAPSKCVHYSYTDVLGQL